MTSKRSPQFWSAIIGSGATGLVLCLIMLITAVWVAARNGAGEVTIQFNQLAVALAALATASLLAAAIGGWRRRESRADSLPYLPGRITLVGDNPLPEHSAEVVVYRNPRSVSQVAVFVDGQRAQLIRTHEISPETEPGTYHDGQWQQMAATAAGEPGASWAWSEQVRAWYEQAEVALRRPDSEENAP